MNFLFDNPLANMPGPWFLFLYGTIIVLTAIAVKVYKSSLDWTSKLQLPLVPQNPNPFEIAYLRGGENEFARSMVFSLVQKGFLGITTEGKKSYVSLTANQPNWTTLSPAERNILPFFQVMRETKDIFAANGVTEILKPYSATYEQNLLQNNFLMPNDVSVKTRLISFIAWGITAALGLYKLTAAILNGRRNIAFLLIFIVISAIIFYAVSKTSRLSNLGKQYVERIQQAFENLKTKVVTPISAGSTPDYSMNAVDPFLLAVGVFGTGALAGTLYNDYEIAFHRASVAGGSSCGSGCGSNCSSGSSGGDGGSSCGGGCGGCGGGCS